MKTVCVLAFFTSSLLAAATDTETPFTSLDFAQVSNVRATQSQDGSWCFDTQVRHNDQGWQHYADTWQIADLKGNVLAIRELAHPHDNEQPFTRSLCNIKLPKALVKVAQNVMCTGLAVNL